MNSSKRRNRTLSVTLIGLPVFANIISFAIFAPLFTPGREPTNADFTRAGNSLGVALVILELVAVGLIIWWLSKQGQSLKAVINFQPGRLRDYLIAGLIALLPTVAAGWLYVRGQAAAGVETGFTGLSPGEKALWYGVIPVAAAVLEEIIWRGYAFPRPETRLRRYIFTAVSFALFHGIFSPLVLLATFIQGIIWAWVYERTESAIPSMALHLMSRYLALVPGFG